MQTGTSAVAAVRSSAISPLTRRQRLFFALGLLFLWPALLNGDVFALSDTQSYMRGADTAVVKLFGVHNPHFADNAHISGAGVPEREFDTLTGRQAAAPLVIYGRSVYFGVFLYLVAAANWLWLAAIVQAFAAMALVIAAVRHFVDPSDERRFGLACVAAAGLLALTSLPYFVCLLMPDVWVGLALVGAALLLAGWRREGTLWRCLLIGLVAFAAVSHASAMGLLLLLGCGGLVSSLYRPARAARLPAALLVAAALLGFVGETAFGVATRVTTGSLPLRPPFLTARLVGDGPGRRYLADHCAGDRFVLCRYPLHGRVTDEIFLWSPVPGRGGFKALPPTDRIAVSREQAAFALAVVRTYPGETVQAMATGLGRQLGRFDLPEFTPRHTASSQLLAPHQPVAVPRGAAQCVANAIVSAILALVTLISVLLLPLVWRSRSRGREIMLIVAAAILANDMICAWLAGPFARYQTRVVWALPFVVLLWWLARRNGRAVEHESA